MEARRLVLSRQGRYARLAGHPRPSAARPDPPQQGPRNPPRAWRERGRYLSFCPHGAGRNLSRTATLAPYKDADGELDPARVQQTIAQTTAGLDIRWFGGAPDLSESLLAYKDATKVKSQIARFGLATVVGEIQPQSCIMAGEAPEPHWMRARREKRASHKEARREGAAEVSES